MSCVSSTATPRADPIRMLDRHEHHLAGLAFFLGNPAYLRDFGEGIANQKILLELQLATGPHPPFEIDGWEETAALGVSVGAYLGHGRHRQKIQPMPEFGQRIALLDGEITIIQGEGQCFHRGGKSTVPDLFLFAYPVLQITWTHLIISR